MPSPTEAESLRSTALPAGHGFFTRRGGVSQGSYASLNCSLSGNDSRFWALGIAGLFIADLLACRLGL